MGLCQHARSSCRFDLPIQYAADERQQHKLAAKLQVSRVIVSQSIQLRSVHQIQIKQLLTLKKHRDIGEGRSEVGLCDYV